MPNKISEMNNAVPGKKTEGDKPIIKEDERKNSPLHQFFVSALKDIYDTENVTLETPPKAVRSNQ